MLFHALVLSASLALQTPAPPPAVADNPVAKAYQLFVQGRKLEDRNDVAGAVAAYRQAIELVPTAAELHAELAGVLARHGRIPEAVAAATQALKLDAKNREANRTLGFIQAQTSDSVPDRARAAALVTEAIGHLELAVADRTVDPGAQFTLGRLYVTAGNFPKAIEILRLFLLDQPGYPDAIVMLAEAYDGAKQPADAIDLLEASVAEMPRVSIMQDELGDLYFSQRKYREAAAAWDRALTGDKADIDVAAVTAKRDRAKALAGR
jgi:tetratricopeptide (TPR) repeat protein